MDPWWPVLLMAGWPSCSLWASSSWEPCSHSRCEQRSSHQPRAAHAWHQTNHPAFPGTPRPKACRVAYQGFHWSTSQPSERQLVQAVGPSWLPRGYSYPGLERHQQSCWPCWQAPTTLWWPPRMSWGRVGLTVNARPRWLALEHPGAECWGYQRMAYSSLHQTILHRHQHTCVLIHHVCRIVAH